MREIDLKLNVDSQFFDRSQNRFIFLPSNGKRSDIWRIGDIIFWWASSPHTTSVVAFRTRWGGEAKHNFLNPSNG